MRVWLGIIVVVVVVACSAKQGAPDLTITVTPNTLAGAQTGQVEVVATNADLSVGAGIVHVVGEAGSLVAGVDLTLDTYGTARVDFTCNPAVDPGCSSGETLTATWTPKGLSAVTASAHVSAGHAGTGGGTGGGGGSTTLTNGTVISTPCTTSPPPPPGNAPTCCVPDAGPRDGVVGCGWTLVKLPAVVKVAFGSATPSPVAFPGPDTFADDLACQGWVGWGGGLADGGVKNIIYDMVTYGVDADGGWTFLEGGQSQSAGDTARLCDQLFMGTAGITQWPGPSVVNVIGQMTLDNAMSAPNQYLFFSLFKK